MTSAPVFDDDRGWTYLPEMLSATEAARLADRCLKVLESLEYTRIGDKPWSGTRRLVDLEERVPEVREILDHPKLIKTLRSAVDHDLGRPDVTFRSPSPGFGGQRLHADDVPLSDCDQTLGLTAIVALVDFTDSNGATRLIPGSHRRPDLQRLSGNLDDHAEATTLTGPAGSVFIFSRHILHAGTPNRSDEPRPAIQICWVAEPD